MELAMMHLASGSPLFEAALERVFEHVFEYCRRLIEACGDSLDIFCIGDDFATQRGLMIFPEQWRRLLKPRFAKLFGMAKQAGRYVWFHSCGDITPVLPDLIDIGMDVWETVQLHTLPITAQELKRDYGQHITFFGAVSTQRLPFRTPDQVRAEVERCIRVLGKDGGYICGPDHHIKPDVSPELAVALFDTAVAFRGNGYTLQCACRPN
jgi:uroporphyrinogen decarboxylase